VKLPSYTINGTRGHHITPNMPQGMSICGQKLGPFMSNQACRSGISQPAAKVTATCLN
jgi:hypothetical protein